MRNATRDQLRDAEWRLYEFVARHFLATVSCFLSSLVPRPKKEDLSLGSGLAMRLLSELCSEAIS